MQDYGNNKLIEVKTFTVPFPLEEIQDNSIFFTNPSSLNSRQIVNQAINFIF